MAKIMLNEEPWDASECPFSDGSMKCTLREQHGIQSTCSCIGGYSDSQTFHFEKCPYCKVAPDTLGEGCVL